MTGNRLSEELRGLAHSVSAPTQWSNMSVRKQLVENSLQQAVNHSEKKHGMTSQQIDRQTDRQTFRTV